MDNPDGGTVAGSIDVKTVGKPAMEANSVISKSGTAESKISHTILQAQGTISVRMRSWTGRMNQDNQAVHKITGGKAREAVVIWIQSGLQI